MSDLASLRVAAAALDPDRVIAALDRALEAWRAPGSRWRAELAQSLATFSPEAIEQGVPLALEDWSADRLAALREREVVRPCWTPEVCAVWLADSPPTAVFAALIAPLLAGASVYAHASSADAESPRLFIESLSEADREVGAALVLGSDAAVIREADAFVAYGRDETVAALRAQRLRAQRPASGLFVGYGHKLSLGIVGPGADLEEAAQGLAFDAALWDGRGCLSPAWALVADTPAGRAETFADALAAALERMEKDLPRGRLAASEHTGLRELRASAALRPGTRVWQSGDSTDWTVTLCGSDGRPPPGSLRRVPVVALPAMDAVWQWCRPLAPHLSCVGHAGLEDPVELERQAARSGASRLCPLGRMQLPPIEWNHDGQGSIRPLTRPLDVEESQ